MVNEMECKNECDETNRMGYHHYGDQTVASFDVLEKLPMFGIIALTNYNLGLLEPVSKEELNQLLEAWRNTPWKSEEEIAKLREDYIQNKIQKNEWTELCECQPTSLPADSKFEESHIQKRKRFDGEV